MKKVVFVFGVIAGIVGAIFSFIIMALNKSEIINFDNGNYFGYTAIVIALSMVFFGVKSYRDNYQKGVISFKKAVLVGLLISLVALVAWAAGSELYYQIDPETNEMFINKYCDYEVDKLKAQGATQQDIDSKVKEIEDMREMHKSPVFRFVMTIAILMPVGIIVTLVSAAILRKREVLPA